MLKYSIRYKENDQTKILNFQGKKEIQ